MTKKAPQISFEQKKKAAKGCLIILATLFIILVGIIIYLSTKKESVDTIENKETQTETTLTSSIISKEEKPYNGYYNINEVGFFGNTRETEPLEFKVTQVKNGNWLVLEKHYKSNGIVREYCKYKRTENKKNILNELIVYHHGKKFIAQNYDEKGNLKIVTYFSENRTPNETETWEWINDGSFSRWIKTSGENLKTKKENLLNPNKIK